MRLCRLCKKLFQNDQAACPDDKSSTVETELEALPGALVERFPEREPLARGGTGTLYLIDRPGSIEDQLGPQLVLKLLSADLTADPAERARHRRDLRKQQGLIHAQLPAVLEEGEVDGRVWFTRKYLPATSLAVRLDQSGALAPDDALHLIVQLCAALDGLHQLGLVHRDLKPGHVLLRAGQPNSLQLIDATLASPLTEDAARRGTADYAAKEIIEGGASTARSDLYALGCLSYELIAGVPPFRAADTEATLLAQRNIEPKVLPDIVPSPVRSAIASMLSKDARRRPFSAQQVRRSIEPMLAPVKPAARSGSVSALQREAAALRLTGPTAKHPAPRTVPDATVELDVKDLDDAIQASEEQDKRAAQAAGVPPKKAAPVDDDAPTIALQSLQPLAASRSGVTETQSSERSATVSSAGGTNPYPPVSEQDLERPARRHVPARGDATTRTHVPSDAAPEAKTSVDAAFDAPVGSNGNGSGSGSKDSGAEAPRRRRTGTKFGIPAVEAPATDSQPVAAADSGAATAESPAELPRRSRTGTMFGIPAVGSLVPGEPPRRSRTGTKFGIPAVGQQVAEPEASDAAAETNAPVADNASEANDDAPRRKRTGTKFGLGPVSNADVEAAALVAQLQREHGAAPEPRAPARKQPTAAKPRARYISTPKALVESPRLLLWAAGGLAALIVLLRLVLGPAERSRSQVVAENVPEAATTELPTAEQAVAEVAEYALIGGDIPRTPLTAATKQPPPAAPTQPPPAEPTQPPATTAPPADEPDSEQEAHAAAGKRVPTVSAVSVRGGLARAASTRPVAVSSKPAASSNPAPLDPKLQARELYKAGKYREAADAYQRATQLNATDAGAFAGLGGSLMATGDFRKAIAAYQRAVRLQPEKSGFQAALGRAYLKKGDRVRARAAYSKALELDPNNQAARSGMASAKAR